MGDLGRACQDGDHDDRLEVHGGRVVLKERPRYEHSDAQAGLATALSGPFQRPFEQGGPGGWWLATEVEIAYSGWTFLHDLAGWRRDRLPTKPSGRSMHEPPDWVCEILSANPASRRLDTVTKFDVLGRAGVRHYWLMDVDARELVVHRLEPAGWLRVGAWVATEPGLRAHIEPFDAVEIEVGVLFGDDPKD